MAEPQDGELGEPPSVAALSISETANKIAKEQEVTPWDVSAGTDAEGNAKPFDYEAIAQKWDTKIIDESLLERFEKVTGQKPHIFLRRGLFFSHRDFDKILDLYERGEKFFLYTGRGPSAGAMHIGHTIPFEFTKYLQEVFDVPLVIMLTEDEKFFFKKDIDIKTALKYAKENAKDIISMGFDVKKTFIYSDFIYRGEGGKYFEYNSAELSKLINFNQVRGAFGFDQSTNVGRIAFPPIQCAAAIATSYPHIFGDPYDVYEDLRSPKTAKIQCLIPMGIDQDPYFRLVRDNASRMPVPSPKPALIHSKFLTALQGIAGKMSSSDPNSAIFMTDTPKEIKNKINKHAFSGGQETLELHREKGGNPDVDVAYQYCTYFLEDDDVLAKLYKDYKSGELLTGNLKKQAIELVQPYVATYQKRRAEVTDEMMRDFMKPRKLEAKGNPNPKKQEEKK